MVKKDQFSKEIVDATFLFQGFTKRLRNKVIPDDEKIEGNNESCTELKCFLRIENINSVKQLLKIMVY